MKKTILTAAVVLACALCLSGPQAAEAAAGKPRVLLIGDSIAVYYTPYVKKLLEGQVPPPRPSANVPPGGRRTSSATTPSPAR